MWRRLGNWSGSVKADSSIRCDDLHETSDRKQNKRETECHPVQRQRNNHILRVQGRCIQLCRNINESYVVRYWRGKYEITTECDIFKNTLEIARRWMITPSPDQTLRRRRGRITKSVDISSICALALWKNPYGMFGLLVNPPPLPKTEKKHFSPTIRSMREFKYSRLQGYTATRLIPHY